MNIVEVTPDTFQTALDASTAGDIIRLQQGTYPGIYTLARHAGRRNTPIVIEADPSLPEGSVKISQERDAEWYRPQANEIARARLANSEYPGIWDEAHKARLRILDCDHITIRNLDFELSWPTHLYLDQSSHITIENCRFLDATFCIVANGQNSHDIVVDGCSWTQDRVPDRIWSGIAWKRIHGHPAHENCPWSVKDDDYRLFDGDFLRTTNIRGGVTVRHCTVTNAFNGVHAEGDGNNLNTNRDFHIHNCKFIQIRDNAVEPEDNAFNWSIHDNLFIDNHAPFSFSCKDLSNIYMFSNLIAFCSIQGTSGSDLIDIDCNRGGKVFKLKGIPNTPHGPNYVFHNSIITRLKYLPGGIFEGLRHFNNAMQFIPMSGSNFDAYPSYFGNLAGPAPKKRFTDQWSASGYSIEMNGDVVLLPGWPDEQHSAGYEIGSHANGSDPEFARTDFSGGNVQLSDFATTADGPCGQSGIEMNIKQPNGDIYTVTSGSDVGAVQRDRKTGTLSLFEGPPFQPSQEPLIG